MTDDEQHPAGRDASEDAGAPRPRERGDRDGQDRKPASPARTAELLTELDLELMKLLVRRARLLSRLRGGKDHAAGPAAVKAEKEVRAAWEKNAARFSRDSKFARQLFALIQDLTVSTREESEKRSGFAVSPPRKPVHVALPGPADRASAGMVAALAAALGRAVSLRGVLLGNGLLDLAKALNQAGAAFSWTGAWPAAPENASRLRHNGRNGGDAPLSFADKVLYAGEDSLSFHLLAFLAAAGVG
jgi:hypothetical protein